MPVEWYQVDFVGFTRAFVVGRNEKGDDVEVELTKSQLDMYNAFLDSQAEHRDAFVKGLVF